MVDEQINSSSDNRRSFWTARVVLRYSSIIILFVWSVFFVIELISLVEYLKEKCEEYTTTQASTSTSSIRSASTLSSCLCCNKKGQENNTYNTSPISTSNAQNNNSRIRNAGVIEASIHRNEFKFKVFLLMTTIAVLIVSGIIIYIEFSAPFEISNQECSILSKVMALSYGLNTQGLYGFFLIRSTLLDGFFHKHFVYRMIFLYLKIGTLAFMPLVMFPLLIVFWDGYILPNGYCIETCDGIWLIVIFLIGNFIYSIGFIFIFIEPLRQNAQLVARQNEGMTKPIMSLVWKNLFLSTVAVGLTVLNLIFMNIAYVVIQNDAEHKWDSLKVWFLTTAYYDMCINAICAKFMTDIWLPKNIYGIFCNSCENSENGHVHRNPNEDYQPSRIILDQSGISLNEYSFFDFRVLSRHTFVEDRNKNISNNAAEASNIQICNNNSNKASCAKADDSAVVET